MAKTGFLNRKRGPRRPVGLDIDSAFLAAAQTEARAIVRAVSTELPPGVVNEGEVVDSDALGTALKGFFRDHDLPRRVRLGVSNQQIVVRSLEVPKLEGEKELDAAVRFQAEDAVAMPLEDAVLDYQVVGEAMSSEGRSTLRVIVVVARASMIDRFLEATQRAGLRPEGIDLNAFALVRTSMTRPAPEEGAKALCHLGGTTNFAVALANTCLFTRPLSTTWDEQGDHVGFALAEEIRLSLDFYATQPEAPVVESVRLSGPGARRDGLVESLERLVGLPVAVADPLGGLDPVGLAQDEDAFRHSVATGLALGAES